MPNLEIHYSGEWAALYVDGKLDLDTVGDTHHAEERAFELTGVKQVYNDAFMRGQTDRVGVAKTLAEVDAYRQAQEGKRARAAELRDQAAALLAEAARLEG